MTNREPIRVLIADDHPMVCRGLTAFLESQSDLLPVGEARDGEEAVRLCAEVHPDVILMDIVMPRMNGATAARIIRERYPQVRIVALTSFDDKKLVQPALEAGAISYLLKSVSGPELASAIRSAHAGISTLAPEALAALVTDGPSPGHDLSAREREVLALMVEGLDNPSIARRLVISRWTAKAHVSQILSKLGVSSRAEAISVALKQKLVSS